MEIEVELLNSYREFIKSNSQFSSVVKILPRIPQSFVSFPTIVFKETLKTDFRQGKTVDKIEQIHRLTYMVEIYSKDVELKRTKKVTSLQVISELRELTINFFNELGFSLDNSTRGETTDKTIDRSISVFSARVNNWNKQIV